MKPTTKRRRKIRHHQIKSPDDDDGFSYITLKPSLSQQMHLQQQLKAKNHYQHQRHKKSVLPTYLITLYCLMMICLFENLNPSLLQVPPVVQAAPGALNHHLSKIASMVTGSSSSSSSLESVATTLTSALPSPSSLSSIPTTSATLVKSARLATYSLTCPPESSIHPCTCLYHMPDALIESEEEEEVYEISSAITTPIAEQLIMTSSSSTTTTTTAKATTTLSPLLATQSQPQAPLAYHAALDHHVSDQISTTATPITTTTRPPAVEEPRTTASPATTTTTTTTTAQPSSSSIAPPNVAALSNTTTIEPLSTSSSINGSSSNGSSSNDSSIGGGSGSLHPQELVTQIQPQLQIQKQKSGDLKLQTLPAHPLEQQPQQQVVVVNGHTTPFALANSTTEVPADMPSLAPVVSVTTEAPTATEVNASQASDQSMTTTSSISSSPVELEPTMSTTSAVYNTTSAPASTTTAEATAAAPAQTSSSSIAPPNSAAKLFNATIEPLSTSGSSNSNALGNGSGWLEPQALVTQTQLQEQQSPPANFLELQSLLEHPLAQQQYQQQQPQQQVAAGAVNTTQSAVSSNSTTGADIPFPAPVASMTTSAGPAALITGTNTSQVTNQSMSTSSISSETPRPTMSTTTAAQQTTSAPASTTAAPTTASSTATTEPPLASSSTMTRAPISTITTGDQLATVGTSFTASPTSPTSTIAATPAPAFSTMRMATVPSKEVPLPTSSTPVPSVPATQGPIHKSATASSPPEQRVVAVVVLNELKANESVSSNNRSADRAVSLPSAAPSSIGVAAAALSQANLIATLSKVTPAPLPSTVAPPVSTTAATAPVALASHPTTNGTTRLPTLHVQTSSNSGHPAQETRIGGRDHTSAPSHSSTTTTTRTPHQASANAESETSVKPPLSTSSTTITASSSHPASSFVVGSPAKAGGSGRASSSGRAIHSRQTSPTAAPAQAMSSSPSTPPRSGLTPTHSPTPALTQHYQSSAALSQQQHAQAQDQANGSSGRQILTPSSHRLRPGLHRHRSPALTSASMSTTTTTTTAPHPVREARAVSSTEAAAEAEQLASFSSTQRLPGGRRLSRYLAHQGGSGGFLFGGGSSSGESSGEPKAEVMAFCRNIQNSQVLHDAIKGFRGHQINYFVIDSCRVPPFPNDLFVGIDVRWLEMTNSTVQFHNNFLHSRPIS